MSKILNHGFDQLSNWIAKTTGKPHTFVIAFTIVLIWAISGPVFGFSDTWQLAINTSTTIITFLMVFLLQNTGNRTITELHDRLSVLEGQNTEILTELKKLNGGNDETKN